LINVPVSGTYTVVMKSSFAPSSFSITATLLAEAAAAVVVGTPVTVNVASVQNASFRFSANASSSPSLKLAFSPTGVTYSVTLHVFKPDGTLLADSTNGTGITTCNNIPPPGSPPSPAQLVCPVQLINVPVSGTYTVVMKSSISPNSFSITATLFAEATATVVVGTPATVNVASVQNASFRFSANAGLSPTLSLSFTPTGFTYAVTLYKYKPDGTLLAGGANGTGISTCNNFSNPSSPLVCQVQLVTVPVTGTYTVVVKPSTAPNSFSITATLSGA